MVAAIVLNWNGADDSIACCESLRAGTLVPHVIVVDNGSSDDSVARLTATGLADELIAVGQNLGFAGGNNVGLARALELGAETIVVINNDTVVRPESFSVLSEVLTERPGSAVSPDIRYFDDPAASWFRGGIVDRGWPRHLQPSELSLPAPAVTETEIITGCCLAASGETWRRVGLFDESYFLIFEDSDWSLRARRAGVDLLVASDSVILHRVSRSFAGRAGELTGSYFFVRNGLRFSAAHCARWIPVFLWRFLIAPAPRTLRANPWLAAFQWFGALGFLLRQRGAAPPRLRRLAGKVAQRAQLAPRADRDRLSGSDRSAP
jgi:GT2 family glycosyltransferase